MRRTLARDLLRAVRVKAGLVWLKRRLERRLVKDNDSTLSAGCDFAHNKLQFLLVQYLFQRQELSQDHWAAEAFA